MWEISVNIDTFLSSTEMWVKKEEEGGRRRKWRKGGMKKSRLREGRGESEEEIKESCSMEKERTNVGQWQGRGEERREGGMGREKEVNHW